MSKQIKRFFVIAYFIFTILSIFTIHARTEESKELWLKNVELNYELQYCKFGIAPEKQNTVLVRR